MRFQRTSIGGRALPISLREKTQFCADFLESLPQLIATPRPDRQMAVDAVCSELLSAILCLLTGKITGNL
jgi:hypothetical protein